MGVEVVYNGLRELEIAENWETEVHDIATAKMHHKYNPRKNYCTVEFRMPTISKQIPVSQFEETEAIYHYPQLHRMKFNKVENLDFHRYMDREGRSTISKIRRYEGNHVTTYYFSDTRRIGLLKHDYFMALIVYLNHPPRFFTRRTPCTKLDPKCIPGCYDILAEPIVSWVTDPEPNTAVLSKYFFSYMGEVHRLCLGYTIEDIKSNDLCFNPIEPDYYTLDLSVKYFNEAFWDLRTWQNAIIKEREDCDTDQYVIYDGRIDTRDDGEALSYGSVSFRGHGGTASALTMNIKNGINVPMELRTAINENNFVGLWQFDMYSLNARNSIHKWTFNHWHDFCQVEDTGWWCAWDVSDVISGGASEAAALGDSGGQVAAQLTQVSSMFGWGPTGDSSSTDTEYIFTFPRLDGYEYKPFFEPLYARGMSMF